MGKITIAIDGYSSTGKSTLAKQLARSLGYTYIDTGAMYRAVTLFAMRKGVVDDPEALIGLLPTVQLKFVYDDELGHAELYLNGENVEKAIRTMDVSKHVSRVSTLAEVRHKLVEMQRAMGKDKGIVMDGRDIGTVVFPEAELKIFMNASPGARATRRYRELLARGENISFEEVLQNVRERDHIDSNRKIAPLRKAPDAIEFDNTDMGLEEQFQRMHGISVRTIAGLRSSTN